MPFADQTPALSQVTVKRVGTTASMHEHELTGQCQVLRLRQVLPDATVAARLTGAEVLFSYSLFNPFSSKRVLYCITFTEGDRFNELIIYLL